MGNMIEVKTICPHCGKSLLESVKPTFSDSDVKRFWSKVTKSDDCWISSAQPSGIYGRMFFGGTQILAHVASWLIHNGEIPAGLKVCHSCDQPRCVRPDHLFLGTMSQNMNDMVLKGRNRPSIGIKNNLAKLSDEQVIEIKRALAAGTKTTRELATENGVTFQSIWLIKKGVNRKHITI